MSQCHFTSPASGARLPRAPAHPGAEPEAPEEDGITPDFPLQNIVVVKCNDTVCPPFRPSTPVPFPVSPLSSTRYLLNAFVSASGRLSSSQQDGFDHYVSFNRSSQVCGLISLVI